MPLGQVAFIVRSFTREKREYLIDVPAASENHPFNLLIPKKKKRFSFNIKEDVSVQKTVMEKVNLKPIISIVFIPNSIPLKLMF